MEFFAQDKGNSPVNTYSHILSKNFPGGTLHEGARGGAGSWGTAVQADSGCCRYNYSLA